MSLITATPEDPSTAISVEVLALGLGSANLRIPLSSLERITRILDEHGITVVHDNDPWVPSNFSIVER